MPTTLFVDCMLQVAELETCFSADAMQLFQCVQTLLKAKPIDKMLIQVLVPNQGVGQLYTALSGLLKTAHLENPNMIGQVIAIDESASAASVIQTLRENSHTPEAHQVRYEQAKRFLMSFDELKGVAENTESLWKTGGVYLITGGAGGLGLIFCPNYSRKTRTTRP